MKKLFSLNKKLNFMADLKNKVSSLFKSRIYNFSNFSNRFSKENEIPFEDSEQNQTSEKDIDESRKVPKNFSPSSLKDYQTKKHKIIKGKDGRPLSIFVCKNTTQVINTYYSHKQYFNQDINSLAKVLCRYFFLANEEGLKGLEVLEKERMVRELIKNLSERIDKYEIMENNFIVDIMKILIHNKIVDKFKRENEMHKEKQVKKTSYNHSYNLIENFVIEKILKNTNFKLFLRNIESGNQMGYFLLNLTHISKMTNLKKKFKFIQFKAELLANYDKLQINRYNTLNINTMIWALSQSNINIPDVYENLTNEMINRYDYITFPNKIQILYTSVKQKNLNENIITKIFNELKNEIKEDENYLMNNLLESKNFCFSQLISFLNYWGVTRKNCDSIMNERIFNNIIKYVYFKFVKRRQYGDDLIFTEWDFEKRIHKNILLDIDRINLFGFILRYSDYGKNFKFNELCFEELYLKRKSKFNEINKENSENFLVDRQDEEKFLIELGENQKKIEGRDEVEEIKEKQEKINDNSELNIKIKNEIKDVNIKDKNENNKNFVFDDEYEDESIIDNKETEEPKYYIANKDRKYEMDLPDIIDEFINVFGYNIYLYLEYNCYDLLNLIFIDKDFKLVSLFNNIFKIMKNEHYKISEKEYIRICGLLPVLLKLTNFLQQNKDLLFSQKPYLNNNNFKAFYNMMQNNEQVLCNFAKGILNENILKFYFHESTEITIVLDMLEIIDKIRIINNIVYSKIINLSAIELINFCNDAILKTLTFDQLLCLNYLIWSLKISLDNKLSENLRKKFVISYRENFSKLGYRPMKKSLINALLYNIDQTDKNEIKIESNRTDGVRVENEENNENIKKKEDHFEEKLVNNSKNESNEDENSRWKIDFDLDVFDKYQESENLRISQNLGIEDRDLYFSINTFDKFDTLLNSLNNVKYSTNKIFDKYYYLDYYIPKLKIGFIIYNSCNYFDITNYQISWNIQEIPRLNIDSMKPLSLRPLLEVFKHKYGIDVFIISPEILKNKSESILSMLKKYSSINKLNDIRK